MVEQACGILRERIRTGELAPGTRLRQEVLAAALRGMAAAIAAQRRDPADDGFAANRSFHLALVASAGNPHLDRFAESLWVQSVGTAIYAAQAIDPSVVAGYADDHQAILDAIEQGDGEVAERRTREHILASPVPAG